MYQQAPQSSATRRQPVRFEPLVETTPLEPGNGGVKASLHFLADRYQNPVSYNAAAGGGEARRIGRYLDVEVSVRDARSLVAPASLDREGFALVRHDAPLPDTSDDAVVRAHYYPEMARLIRANSGAADVLVFDHNVRFQDGARFDGDTAKTPVFLAHNDYTERSAPQRLRDLLGVKEAEKRLRGRFAIINAWRPIRGPVQTAPLAVADAGSVPKEDLVAAALVYPERTGEIYHLVSNPGHRWFYYPAMETDEVLLIKGYDSLTDGRARFAPHTAFHDPNTPPNAAPRESIEIRALAFFD